MVQIPERPPIGTEELAEWYKIHQELAKLRAREVLLRRAIFGHFFATPKEGVNTFVLPDEYQLKGTHVINRSVDKAMLSSMGEFLKEQGINVDKLIDYKPELVKSAYNKLSDEERRLFDRVLVIKPGTPKLEIVPPKKK